MIALVRPVLSLLAAVFILMTGVGPLTSVIGVRMTDADFSPLVIGAVNGCYFAGLTLGALKAARLVWRVGHIRSFAAYAAGMCAAALGHSLWFEPVAWGVLRLIAGFCMAGLFICIESWLNQAAVEENRGRILSLYMISVYAAQGLGQLQLSLDDGVTARAFILIAMAVVLAMVPVAVTRQTPPTLPDVHSFSFRRLYAASPLGVFGVTVSGLITGAFYGLGGSYARELGYDNTDTSFFLTAVILGGVLLQWPLGKLSDLFDRRRVLVATIAVLAVASAAMSPLAEYGLWGLLASGAVFGGMCFAVYPVGVAHTNDHLSASDMVGASGGLVLAYSAGATCGPFAASAVMEFMGADGLFIYTGVVAALATVFGFWRMTVRPPVPADEQGPFQILPRTTPTAGVLDPRGEPMGETGEEPAEVVPTTVS